VDLREIDCKTVVVEQHYIDRVFMHDDAVFYVRNLRSYPNFTSRLHFFADEFDQSKWRDMVTRAAGGAHGGRFKPRYNGTIEASPWYVPCLALPWAERCSRQVPRARRRIAPLFSLPFGVAPRTSLDLPS
jgi:hypothetical protein